MPRLIARRQPARRVDRRGIHGVAFRFRPFSRLVVQTCRNASPAAANGERNVRRFPRSASRALEPPCVMRRFPITYPFVGRPRLTPRTSRLTSEIIEHLLVTPASILVRRTARLRRMQARPLTGGSAAPAFRIFAPMPTRPRIGRSADYVLLAAIGAIGIGRARIASASVVATVPGSICPVCRQPQASRHDTVSQPICTGSKSVRSQSRMSFARTRTRNGIRDQVGREPLSLEAGQVRAPSIDGLRS